MKKTFTFLVFALSLIGSTVYAGTPDFVYGYNNHKWGTDISKQPGYVKVSSSTPLRLKEKPKENGNEKEKTPKDLISPVAAFCAEKQDGVPFQSLLDHTKKFPRNEKEQWKVLAGIYRKQIGATEAEAWHHCDAVGKELLKGEYLSPEGWKLLCEAEAGDIDSIQALVRQNPETLRFPFVIEGIIDFLRKCLRPR